MSENNGLYKKDQILAVVFQQLSMENTEKMTLGEMVRYVLEKSLLFQ